MLPSLLRSAQQPLGVERLRELDAGVLPANPSNLACDLVIVAHCQLNVCAAAER